MKRETDRKGERERQRQRQRQRETERGTERQRQRQKQISKQRGEETERQRSIRKSNLTLVLGGIRICLLKKFVMASKSSTAVPLGSCSCLSLFFNAFHSASRFNRLYTSSFSSVSSSSSNIRSRRRK